MTTEPDVTLLEPLMGADEVGKQLGFSGLTIRRWAREGRLPAIAIPFGISGKTIYRFRASELTEYLQSRRVGKGE